MFFFTRQLQVKSKKRKEDKTVMEPPPNNDGHGGGAGHLEDEKKFIPVALEIPVSQLAKVKEGHDLLIRMRNSEIIGTTSIREEDRLDELKIGNDTTTIIRVKKISTTKQPQVGQIEIFQPRHRKISKEQQPTTVSTVAEALIARVKKISGVKQPDTAALIVPKQHLLPSEEVDERSGSDNKAFSSSSDDDNEGKDQNGNRSPQPQRSRRKHGVLNHNHDEKLFDRVKKISTGQEPRLAELRNENANRKLSHSRIPNITEPNDLHGGDFALRKRSGVHIHFDGENGMPLSPLGMGAGVVAPVEEQFNPSDHDTQKLPQVFAALGASLGAFAFGTVLAWSSTAAADLANSTEFGRKLTSSEISWISSLAVLGAVGSCPLAGYGMGRFGRRKVMLYLTGPFILGWILIALARDVWQIYLGRFITGLCGGCFSIAVPIFTSETADSQIRGGLGTFFDILMSGGMLYIYVIGQYTPWRLQAAVCAVIPLIFHTIMFFIPESPRYLMEKEKAGKAEKAMYWLKGVQTAPALVKWEMSEISRSVSELRNSSFTIRDTFRRPIVKPTILMLGIMFFTTLSGFDVVVAYTVAIFNSAGAGLDPGLSTIIIGVVSLFASLPSAIFVDLAGRKMLLMISGICMSFSLSALGFFFYVKNEAPSFAHAEDLSWLPLTALIAFIISFSLGFGPLHILMIGEVLPNHMKGLTSCVVLMSRWLMAFILTNSFQALNSMLAEHGTFWLFACICVASIPYVYFCIPETKGKTVDEIQIYFVKA